MFFDQSAEQISSQLAKTTSIVSQDIKSVVDRGINVLQDTEQNLFKTVDNLGGGAIQGVKFVAKNTIGLLDNQFDHLFELVDDVRVDVSNSITLFGIMGGAGILFFLIMYGEAIQKNGLKISGLSVF